MPTDNPRLVAYPDRALYERLKKYQEAKGLKTLSKTAIAALEEYFRQLDMPKKVEENDIESIKRELAILRERLEQLSKKVVGLEQQHQD